MKETVNITIRMDKETKEKAEVLFNELGMNMSTAISIFLKQALRDNGLPFKVSANITNHRSLCPENEDLDDLF